MSQFIREDRYLVLKRSDIAALSTALQERLFDIASIIHSNRLAAHKQPLQCVVVEHDWPEYEVVWKLIEDRDIEIEKMGAYFAVWQATGKRLAEWHKRCLAEGYAGGVQEVLDLFFSKEKQSEFAWLIEDASEPPNFLTMREGHFIYTGDRDEAIRFGRTEDAERISKGCGGAVAIRGIYFPCDGYVTAEQDRKIGAEWRENSSLEKWFPFTADIIRKISMENKLLKIALHPSIWDKEQSDAWHLNVPDIHAAFAALRAVTLKEWPEVSADVVKETSIGVYGGRRDTPIGTKEFFGFLNDGIETFPFGTKLYVESPFTTDIKANQAATKTAWLIEDYNAVPNFLTMREGIFGFTGDIDEALQFCRKADAEKIVGKSPNTWAVREHQWPAAPMQTLIIKGLDPEQAFSAGMHELNKKISTYEDEKAKDQEAQATAWRSEPVAATDEQIQEWNDRHGVEHGVAWTDLRACFEDAQTLIHPIPAAPAVSPLWQTFRDAGLLWWINRQLHLFGWDITVDVEQDGSIVDIYPVRYWYRGFKRADEIEGFRKLTAHCTKTFTNPPGDE